MSAAENGQPETPKIPAFPWEIVLRTASFFLEPGPDGSMTLAFAPSVGTPRGAQWLPPATKVFFSAEGWQRFKDAVAVDGEVSKIAIARTLPPDPPKT